MRRIVQQIAFVAAFLLAAVTTPAVAQRILYVDNDALASGDGRSWATAYRFLQDALADTQSSDEPIEIRVARGLYKPDQGADVTPGDREATFQLINGVTLAGGFAGLSATDPEARDVALYQTVLSGDLAGNDADVNDLKELFRDPTRAENSYHVVTGSGTDETAVLDGMTIAGGNADADYFDLPPRSTGGGMYNDQGKPTVANCIFKHNASFDGGGVYNINSQPTFTNCRFTANMAELYAPTDVVFGGCGAGIHNDQSDATITDCTFLNNYAEDGAGVFNYNGSDAIVTRCTFIANVVFTHGGGMCNHEGSNPTLVDCTFGDNSAYHGGAVSNTFESNPTLTNCTIYGNLAADHGGGIYNGSTSGSLLQNCILWANQKEQIYGSANISYSNVQGNVAGVGNIHVDPLFADPANDDYHLKSQTGRWDPDGASWVQDDVTSPCIDAGDPNSPIGDEPFPNGGIINMGAYGGTAEASMSPAWGPTEGQWTEPVRLDKISSDLAEEWSPTLSADGLTMYFTRVHSPISEYGRIFQARRRNTSEAFGSVRVLPSPLNTLPGHVLCLWVSPGQLRMYYMFQDDAIFSLKVSERSSTWALWPMGTDLWELNRFGHRLAAPYLTADERIIFFSASDLGGTIADYDIWMAMRPDRDALFSDPVGVEPVNTTFNEVHSFITPDGLTMYFASDRNGRYQLFRSAREDLDSPFDSPVHMTLFDTPDDDSRFPFLAADGSEFYFQRETNQDPSTRDIWVSYRID